MGVEDPGYGAEGGPTRLQARQIAEVLTDIPSWMTGYGYGEITTWLAH